MTQLDELIEDLNKISNLQFKIQKEQSEIDSLIDKVNNKIDKLVYTCSDVDEMAALCDAFGLDNKGYRWGWKEAYNNSFGGDTDYEKTEWSDIKFNVSIELRSFVGKKSKRKMEKRSGDELNVGKTKSW